MRSVSDTKEGRAERGNQSSERDKRVDNRNDMGAKETKVSRRSRGIGWKETVVDGGSGEVCVVVMEERRGEDWEDVRRSPRDASTRDTDCPAIG